MKRPSRFTGLVALVLVVTIAAGLAWHFYWAKLPNFDDVGGTLLVYQVDKRARKPAGDTAQILKP